MKTRTVILALGAGIAALIALHPPWIARAVVMRMSFEGFPKVPPTTVVDTVSWAVPFAAIYARPSLGLPPRELRAYQGRLSKGDRSAALDWRNRVEDIERRYRVPDELKSKWTPGPVPATGPPIAFTKHIVAARFEVDVVRLAVYLLTVVGATTAAAVVASRRASPRT
jgi:hypothetical protein